MTEDKVIELCKNGVEYAFEILVEKYHQPLYKYIFNYTKDKPLAEDLVQETFIKMIKNIDKYNFIEGSSFSTWLFTIAKNTLKDEFRKRKNYKEVNLDENAETEVFERNIDDEIIRLDQKSAIKKAMDSLSDISRSMFYLRFQMDLSYKEIAKIYNCTTEKVKWRLHDALIKLRRIMGNEVDTNEK